MEFRLQGGAQFTYDVVRTNGGVLKMLQELQDPYPNSFYNGEANEHIMGISKILPTSTSGTIKSISRW